MTNTDTKQDGQGAEMQDIHTVRAISHSEAGEIAARLINSHFHQEPCGVAEARELLSIGRAKEADELLASLSMLIRFLHTNAESH